MIKDSDIFQRAQLLLAPDVMKRISSLKIIIFGVGGVGSWCAESLIRSGIKNLTLVDYDVVAPSNINRQLMATTNTIGLSKVEVLKQRLKEISPTAQITIKKEFYSLDTQKDFFLEDYDYIIDAIDSLKDKALLILNATKTTSTLFSSMGAALKLDPTLIKVAEFWKVKGCPLARALRNKFKQEKPKKKFLCVFSDERLENKPLIEEKEILAHKSDTLQEKKRINGSLVHITAIFGFTLAGLVIKDVASKSS